MVRQKTTKRTVLRLRQARRARELTQEQLAKRVGAATATICRIEKGLSEPNITLALALARELGEPVEALFAFVKVPA